MTWHKAWYGDYNDPDGRHWLDPTFDRKDILKRAEETARKTGKVVTVMAEKGTWAIFWKVSPDGDVTRV